MQVNNNSIFPKGPIDSVTGRCIVLRGDDIDTDRIIPARFLKCVSFNHLGDHVFADDRIEQRGRHPFDNSKNQGSSILVVNDNFGCGSSREHAPQALMRWGIRAIVGQSFAEIFYGNCLALGIPCATSKASEITRLQEEIERNGEQNFSINLESQMIKAASKSFRLLFDKGSLEMLQSLSLIHI